MSILIRTLTLGIATTNSYIIGDTERGEAIVIDPVDNAPLIYRTAQQEGWEIKLILATHAHFDHILASKALKEITQAPFYIHEDCQPWLDSLPQQGIYFGLGAFPEAAIPDRLLTSEQETIEVGAITLKTIYTPGHAPGHLAFYLPDQKIVFSGDTLFNGSIGRTDLPGGDYEQLMQSIHQQLLPLGDDVQVLAGHMSATTIGKERATNPFLNAYTG